jgi:hypothetical protein
MGHRPLAAHAGNRGASLSACGDPDDSFSTSRCRSCPRGVSPLFTPLSAVHCPRSLPLGFQGRMEDFAGREFCLGLVVDWGHTRRHVRGIRCIRSSPGANRDQSVASPSIGRGAVKSEGSSTKAPFSPGSAGRNRSLKQDREWPFLNFGHTTAILHTTVQNIFHRRTVKRLGQRVALEFCSNRRQGRGQAGTVTCVANDMSSTAPGESLSIYVLR